MKKLRIIALLLLLLSGSNFGVAFPSGVNPVPSVKENTSQLSEDLQAPSYSLPVTSVDLFNKMLSFSSSPFAAIGNSSEISRSKSYFSISSLIEPGLGLAEIIFPFHSFL